METLGLSDSTPKPRGRLLELFWPLIDSDVAARTAAQNAMYACAAIGLFSLLLVPLTGNAIGAVAMCLFYLLAAAGIRSFSRIAAWSAFAIYGIDLVLSMFIGGAFGLPGIVVRVIVTALLVNGIRAQNFASGWKKEHPGEDIRREPLEGLTPMQRFYAKLPVVFWPFARPVFLVLLALYPLALIVLAQAGLFVRVVRFPSGSMEPTIHSNDSIVVFRRWVMGPLNRGDVVMFTMPFANELSAKRIVGVAGDRIRLRGGQLVLNGRHIVESYVQHVAGYSDPYRDDFPAAQATEAVPYPQAVNRLRQYVRNDELVVPPGYLFVLGDNRDFSLDSRYLGLVPEDSVVGRPFYVSASRTGARFLERVRIGH